MSLNDFFNRLKDVQTFLLQIEKHPHCNVRLFSYLGYNSLTSYLTSTPKTITLLQMFSVMSSYQYFSRWICSVIESMFHLRITRNFARLFVSVFFHSIVFTLVVESRKYQCHVVIFNTYQHKFYAISFKILFYIFMYQIKENTLNKKYCQIIRLLNMCK